VCTHHTLTLTHTLSLSNAGDLGILLGVRVWQQSSSSGQGSGGKFLGLGAPGRWCLLRVEVDDPAGHRCGSSVLREFSKART